MRFAPLCVFAIACHIQTPIQSSRALLEPEGSEIIVNEQVQPAALDVVKQFAQRGFMLAGLARNDRGILLRLTGDRRTVFEAVSGDVTYGSAFYVRLEPRGPSETWISMIGRPIRDGAELCTPDPDLTAPCVENARSLSEAPGIAEADVIQSVFTELRLRGVVISEDPTPRIIARKRLERCDARRQELLGLANRAGNARARASIIGALPKCDDLAAQPAP